MKMFTTVFAAMTALPAMAFTAEYKIDPSHTNVTFTAPHMMISKVKGRFDKVDGSFNFDEKTQKLDNLMVTIKADSVNTNEKDRDKHLRSPEFLDVEKFPELKFKGTKVTYKDTKPEKVEGDLTIHGITKKVTLNVEYRGSTKDPQGNQVVAFDAETKVNRKDFGLNWNKTLDQGGVLVGDDIKIEIDGEAKMVVPKK